MTPVVRGAEDDEPHVARTAVPNHEIGQDLEGGASGPCGAALSTVPVCGRGMSPGASRDSPTVRTGMDGPAPATP